MNEQRELNRERAKSQLKLADAWRIRGKNEAAISGYQQAICLDPDCVEAYTELGNLLVKVGNIKQAVENYQKALALDMRNPELRFCCNYLKDLLTKGCGEEVRGIVPKSEQKQFSIKDNPNGKINLYNQKTFRCHRSGWNLALDSLKSLHNRRGILFDGFIENNFAWKHWINEVRPRHVLEKMRREGTFDELATSEEKGITPYTEPWVGFLHNPQGMPAWFHYQESPQSIFAKNIWKESLKHCLGLFTFSEYHANWLREQTGKPISSLIHPTEFPDLNFDLQGFLKNPHKKIIQIGWWQRRLNSIYQLPIPSNNLLNYEKIRLVPLFFDNAHEYLKGLTEREKNEISLKIDPNYAQNTREIIHVPDLEYDDLLCQNLAFVQLYDANANNVVVECIARATPLLINRLPAVVEYLGEDYPMYFTNLAEAAEKALDTSLIFDTHNYLKNLEIRDKLTAEYFLSSFERSEVYRLI